MLRHLGSKRTFKHNFGLAALLGITAGFVNAAGYLAFAVLTTNVTGHAALFAEKLAIRDWLNAVIVAMWMLLFLGGAITSTILVSLVGRNHRYGYVLPILGELAILLAVAGFGHLYNGSFTKKAFFAGGLLFAMGMQNALVSLVSGFVVRTTHLTGTFTDLGIDIAHSFQQKGAEQKVLKPRIRLRLIIIICFMIGGAGGRLPVPAVAVPCFLCALLYPCVCLNLRRGTCAYQTLLP